MPGGPPETQAGSSLFGEMTTPDHLLDRALERVTELSGTLSDAQAKAWLVDVRWGNEPACPRCGASAVEHGKSKVLHCPTCKRQFSVRTDTWLEGRKAPLRFEVSALLFYRQEMDPKKTQAELVERCGATAGQAQALVENLHRSVAQIEAEEPELEEFLDPIEPPIPFAFRPWGALLCAALLVVAGAWILGQRTVQAGSSQRVFLRGEWSSQVDGVQVQTVLTTPRAPYDARSAWKADHFAAFGLATSSKLPTD